MIIPIYSNAARLFPCKDKNEAVLHNLAYHIYKRSNTKAHHGITQRIRDSASLQVSSRKLERRLA